jgi:hypothetical protein
MIEMAEEYMAENAKQEPKKGEPSTAFRGTLRTNLATDDKNTCHVTGILSF